MIRLGGHGLPTGSYDPFAFARAHVEFGYGAAYCPPVTIGDTARLAAIEKAFAAENVKAARRSASFISQHHGRGGGGQLVRPQSSRTVRFDMLAPP